MSDLTEFLLARIAEDETDARERPSQAPIHTSGCYYYHHTLDAGWYCDCDDDGALSRRLLAECDAKRRIVELHEHPEGSCWEMHRGVYGPGWPSGSYAIEGQSWAHPSLEPPEVHPGPCETLQLLALPYADHPDYRPEWRP